jgi:hypothetical protein
MMNIMLLLLVSLQVSGAIVPAQQSNVSSQQSNEVSQSKAIDSQREEQLHEQYLAFLATLNPAKIEADYAGAVRKIRSANPDEREKGLQLLGNCDEIDAIALIVELLDSEDRSTRIDAGAALDNLVTSHELKRRDMSQGDKIVLLPRSPEDVDLRPLAWLILKMMRALDDGNTAAYAATMAAYLGLTELKSDLEKLLKSQHRAVSDTAADALLRLKNNPNI